MLVHLDHRLKPTPVQPFIQNINISATGGKNFLFLRSVSLNPEREKRKGEREREREEERRRQAECTKGGEKIPQNRQASSWKANSFCKATF
jgi:hypothetical protein